MKIHAVLSNKQYPEYGVASIPFPIESDDYARIIDLLEPLEIGSVSDADCFVEELGSDLPVLQILERQEVNVDELDYLAKRLDSFAPYELTQFQAVATQRGYYKLKDLINLTFCCQEATVVADFSNLEDIGRKHFLITQMTASLLTHSPDSFPDSNSTISFLSAATFRSSALSAETRNGNPPTLSDCWIKAFMACVNVTPFFA